MRMEAVMVVGVLAAGACDDSRSTPPPLTSKLAAPTADQVAAAKRPPEPEAVAPQQEEDIGARVAAGRPTPEDIKLLLKLAEANEKKITFAHLKKNADKYKGEPWAFRGKILEIAEVSGRTRARIAIDAYGQKVMWVEAPFTTDFVEDNTVDLVGVLHGSFSYTSQAGWNLSIPALVAAKITKRGELVKRKRVTEEEED